jgi:hypothetical protein
LEIILPGNATEKVYLRPPDATGTALGFDVSSLGSPLIAAYFRYSVGWSTIGTYLLGYLAHVEENWKVIDDE